MKSLIAILFSSFILVSACDNKGVGTTPQNSSTPTTQPSGNNSGKVQFAQVKTIVEQRCLMCHNQNSGNPSGGVAYNTDQQIQSGANRIKARAVIAKDMPKFNQTKITDEERELLGKWVDEGATL